MVDAKKETEWPESISGVIDLEELVDENELLAPLSSASSDASDSSDNDEDSDVEVEDEPWEFPEATPLTGLYINVSSLVIHCKRANGVFKCGRKIASSYSPVWGPHGLRCGHCFPE